MVFSSDKNYTARLSPFFCPRLEKRRNGPTVVGNKRQSFGGSFQKQAESSWPRKLPFSQVRYPMHYQRTVATSETIRAGQNDPRALPLKWYYRPACFYCKMEAPM
jgi:hypothetical protein